MPSRLSRPAGRLLAPLHRLWVTLALTSLLILLLGLAVTGTATWLLFRGSLVQRLDANARSAADTVRMSSAGIQDSSLTALPPRTVVATTDAAGRVLTSRVVDEGPDGSVVLADPGPGQQRRQAPQVAVPPTLPPGPGTGGADVAIGGVPYRLLSVPTSPSTRIVVAIPADDVKDTLEDFLKVEVAVGVITSFVLLPLVGLAVRGRLAPLEQVRTTAQDVAQGDLTRRVGPTDTRTDVGRLGRDVDVMLDSLEQAMQESLDSQAQLRRFLADVSHELRTPLTSIRGYAQMFARGASENPDDLALVMRRITEESARMAILVQDLLALARMEPGSEPARRPVDLAALVTDVVADACAAHPDRQVRVEAEPATVTGVDGLLVQAVGNLVRNALVHTSGDVEVVVRPDGGQVIVAVRDHGRGIPAEQARTVFERFERIAEGASRDRGGSGLGLAVVAAVAEQHDGTVTVRDAPGGGALFELRLPVRAAGAAAAPPAPPAPSPALGLPARR